MIRTDERTNKFITQVGYLQKLRHNGLLTDAEFDKAKIYIKTKYSVVDFL